MNAFFALIRKDLRLYFTNRRALLVNLALPIVIAAFFGALFGGGGGNDKRKTVRIPVAVVDLDRSKISTALIKNLSSDAAFDIQSLTEPDAIDQVRRGKIRAAVVIPEKFGAQAPRALFGAGVKPQITVHFDPSQSMVMAMVKGMLAQHAMRAVTETAFSAEGATKVFGDFRAQVATSGDIGEARKRDLLTMFDSIERVQSRDDAPAGTAGTAGGKPTFDLPFSTRELEVAAGGERKYNSFSHSLAGMSVQFMLFLGIEFGVNLLLARRLGLWKRLRAAPLSRTTLLGATIAGGTLITAIMMTIIYLIGMLVFGLRIDGSVAGFFGVVVAFALFTATFGLLIASIGNTPEASRGIAVFATLILVMLGGAWVPSFVFPEWLQSATLAVPTRWAIDGLAAMTWRGLGIDAALAPMGVLLLFAAAFGAIALWRFKWEE